MRYIIITDSPAECADEISRSWPGAKLSGESFLDVEVKGSVPRLIFAQQYLPDPVEFEVASISKGAEVLATRIIDSLGEFEDSWALHFFPLNRDGGNVRRIRLIEEATLELIKRRQKRLIKSLRKDWSKALIQCAFVSGEEGYYSCALERKLGALELSNYPGGVVDVPYDREPPARAYRKLLEAELRFGRHISKGQTVVDLGASPGSWSYIALNRGANVWAIDRSPLRSDLMSHGRMSFSEGDAFSYTPERAVDWLICDVVAEPRRTSQLLGQWLENRWCNRFIVTLKFKGEKDWPVIKGTQELVEGRCKASLIIKLTENKNEITVCGELLSGL